MKKFTIAVLSLLCAGQLCGASVAAEVSPLNPPTRFENITFRQLCGTVCMALAVYKLDAIEGLRKEAIMARHGRILSDCGVRFDLDRMDVKRKGWTRYYPVSAGANTFVVRIFLTRERSYQPSVPVLYEMDISDPQVTCQILPSVSSIVESQRMSPIAISDHSPAGRSL